VVEVPIEFVPISLSVSFPQSNAKVTYNIHLQTPTYEGAIGGAEVVVSSAEIEEKIEALRTAIVAHLMAETGLSQDERSLEPISQTHEDEDPL
jgi:hypothetical protein